MIPGICLCLAPGLGAQADVTYCLYPNGFLSGSGAITNDPIFHDADGTPMSSRFAQTRARGPLAKIDYFLQGAFVGRYSGTTSSPMPITGFMANANYTGGAENRHRRGRGRYVITSRELAQRVAQALHLDNALPSETGLGSSFADFLEVADQFRGRGSEFAAWFNTLNAALRGTMNLAVLSYLRFPAP